MDGVRGEGSILQVDRIARVPERIVYPFSVVSGGVADSEEALAATRRDAAVQAHYSGIRLERAWMTDNPQARLVHVSYRKGDRIYWTRNKVRIAAGERLLTDGQHAIRARCGNRIAETPLGVVEPEGAPAEGILDTPVLDEEPMEETRPLVETVPSALFIEDPSTVQPPDGQSLLSASFTAYPELWWQSYPSLYAGGFLIPRPLTPVPPAELEEEPRDGNLREIDPAEVPEPSAFALMALGLAVLYFGRFSRRRELSRF